MSKSKKRFRKTITYIMGEDFSKAEFDRWEAEVALWISESQANERDPKAKANSVMKAAMNGTKLDGTFWNGVESYTFDKRIIQLCNYNILTGHGSKRSTRASKSGGGVRKQSREINKATKTNTNIADVLNLKELIEQRERFKVILYEEFPFLDNPVYENKVNAYADTVVKLEEMSEGFLGAEGKVLDGYLKTREALRKDLDDYMKLLKIHPSQIKDKVDEGDRGDVGSLINHWEEYTEVADLYEVVDSIQEAIQVIRQLENVRMDGSPQLADWLLWHKTGCRGHKFRCNCGAEYDLHGGFTREEMYQITEQAYEVFGYGIKRVNEKDNNGKRSEIPEEAEEDESEIGGQILLQ